MCPKGTPWSAVLTYYPTIGGFPPNFVKIFIFLYIMEVPPALLPFFRSRFKRAVNAPYDIYCEFCFCQFIPEYTFIPDKKIPPCRWCEYDIKYRKEQNKSDVEIKKINFYYKFLGLHSGHLLLLFAHSHSHLHERL